MAFMMLSMVSQDYGTWVEIWHDEKGYLGRMPLADLAKFVAVVQAESTQRKDESSFGR